LIAIDEDAHVEIDGMPSWICSYSFQDTMQRLLDAIREQGMTIFGHIDHAKAAADAGLELRPLQVLVFGNALAGTRLMQRMPTIGIDLPLRATVWSDDEGTTWFAYNDPGWIAARHDARSGNEQVLAKMRCALTAIAEYVSCPQPSG
jgi:uncharacterized protein (DUF302 family)